MLVDIHIMPLSKHFQKILEGLCLNSIRLTAPLYILLGMKGISLNSINLKFSRKENNKKMRNYKSPSVIFLSSPVVCQKNPLSIVIALYLCIVTVMSLKIPLRLP